MTPVRAAAFAVAALAATVTSGARADVATVLTVDTTDEIGTVNRELVGFGWHEGGAPLAAVAPLEPHLVRIDASLERVSTGPGAPLELSALLARVAEVRAVGGEPLVILSYLPAWLGEAGAHGRDPTRVRPSDLDAWQAVVHDVVLALATAPAPALRFEAWNEPDVPLFWQDTPAAWVDTVARSAQAVAQVESETGLDLAFGGPAVAFPDPAYIVPFLHRFRDPALPLDFVSWHYYGNHPFFGPDGAEFAATEAVHPVLGRRNPVASPSVYGPQVPFVRDLAGATLAGSGRAVPELVLDEWNLSAAGFDRRHDTAAGAAFAAGVLAELQDAGLDVAAFFRANDTRGVVGEHGAVRIDGTPKPVWWAFSLWQHLPSRQLAVGGATTTGDELWAIAARDAGSVVVLVAAFEGDPRRVRIDLGAERLAGATVRRIDDAHAAPVDAVPVALVGSTVELDLPGTGVALVEVTLAPDG